MSLGFDLGPTKTVIIKGNPEYAHYPLFEDVLDDFGVTEKSRRSYQPTEVHIS